ncbi:MAG: DUF2799 domain-containing protein [Candidatus Phaeomarinobacter sp.]
MRALLLFSTCLTLLTLSACATMTADQCAAADWQAVGYEDAMEGRAASHLQQHIAACTDHGITANETNYMAGHTQGATAFCTPTNGFKQGIGGKPNTNICPDDLANAFSVTYEAGRGLYTRKRAVTQAENDLATLERRMQALETSISNNENAIATLGLSQANRSQVQAQLNADRSEHQRLSKQRKRAQEQVRRTEGDYDRYRTRVEDEFFQGS